MTLEINKGTVFRAKPRGDRDELFFLVTDFVSSDNFEMYQLETINPYRLRLAVGGTGGQQIVGEILCNLSKDEVDELKEDERIRMEEYKKINS